jgi:hypothetical protein
MSLRIAFDCDGVIANLDSALAEVAVRLFGEASQAETEVARPKPPAAPDAGARPGPGPTADVRPDDPGAAGDADAGPSPEEELAAPARYRALTRRQQHDLWEAVRKTENFWETLNETEPGIVARLAKIAKERRWEVIFITQRPSSAGDITQLQTQRWLTAHGYELPNVYVIKGTRGKVAEALSLDVVVDDRPENCLDVKLESPARAILVWNGDIASVPPNARKLGIETVNGIGACLDLLIRTPTPKPCLLSKLKKLVGA